MNSSYETINEVATIPVGLVLASRTNRMPSQIATTSGIPGQLSNFGIVSGSAASVLYGPQAINDVLMISPGNQTTQSVHIATLAVCNVLIGIVVLMGCVGNGAVIVQVITNWNARYGFAPLILNLAVSDFLICSCLSPVFLIFLFRSPPTPNIFCGLFIFMGTICTLSSLLTMTAIALHRYRLMSSSAGQRYLSIPISLLTLAFIWALGFSVALAGILYVSSNWNDPFQKCELIKVTNNERGDLSDFAISFLAPVCALGFICTATSCLVMLWVARLPTCWKNACEFYNAEAAKSDQKPKISEVISNSFKQLIGCFSMVDKETRILYLVAILVASFCWAPILIAHILTLSTGESLVLYQLKLCGIALVFLNSALHPYIYTEHGWRLKHRYRVCLHAAFDCHRMSPADQWSLGGVVAANSTNVTGPTVQQPSVVSVGTVNDDLDTISLDTAIRTMTTMTVTGGVVETRICDCNKNVICNRSHGDLTVNASINKNIVNDGDQNSNELDAAFAGEIEDNDTLDSGIDRDALSEVEDMDNEVDGAGDSASKQSSTNRQIFLAKKSDEDELQNYVGSLDSLILTDGSSESSLYCADAAENLTVALPPRNSTPTVPATVAVGSRRKSGGAIIARHSPLSSWSAAPLHRHPPAPPTSPTQQRHLYHYHHLHHHHHVILFPNNGDCVGAADTATLHRQSCHAAGCREYEPVKKDAEVKEEEQQQLQEDVKSEVTKENNTFCGHRNCDEAFRQEVAVASASGNKAAEVLLRLLNIGERSSSSLPASHPSSSIQPPRSSPRHQIASRSPPPCTCPSRLASPLSAAIINDPEEDCPAQIPLISYCPQHRECSKEGPHSTIHHIKGSEYWYPSHDDGVFVTEHSYPDPQHTVLQPNQTPYHHDQCKFYPQKQTYTYSHHKAPHEHTQTELPSRQKNSQAQSKQTKPVDNLKINK